MNTVLDQRRFKITLRFVMIGIIAGISYPVLGREIFDPIAVLNGFTIGFIGSLFLSYTEFYNSSLLKTRMKFIPQVLFKTIFYSSFFILLILLVYSTNRSLFAGKNYFEYIRGPEFSAFIYEGDFNIIVGYTLIMSAAIIFVHQISLKMGQGVLLDLIIGRYHKPKKEDRIFMFLDLNHSTTLAEKMGDIKYHRFINDFFQDITDPIVQSFGIIYRYVGDEMVVTWKLHDGLKNANCLRAFFLSRNEIRKNQEKFLSKYEVIPEFKAGFHIGSVVIGEVGDVKSQIVLSGNTLYEGNIIEKKCRTTGSSLLISEPLMNKLELPKFMTKTLVTEMNSNYQGSIKLYTVKTTGNL